MNRTHVIPKLLTPQETTTIAVQYFTAPDQWNSDLRDWVRREANNLVRYAAYAADLSNVRLNGNDRRQDFVNPYGAIVISGVFTSLMTLYRYHEVDGQPYENADQMRAFLTQNGYLQISRDFNEPAWWGKETNLLFRYAHDTHHCWTGDCNFELDGEICAFTKFAAEIPFYLYRNHGMHSFPPQSVINALYGLLWGEIVGQVCYLRHFKNFPDQKEVVYSTPYDLSIIKRTLEAYQIPHLLGA